MGKPDPKRVREIHLVDPMFRVVIRQAMVGRKPWPLFVYGPAGGGKTCAALCIADAYHATYWTAKAFVDRYRQCVLGEAVTPGGYAYTEFEFWTHYVREPMVIIDDIGRGRMTDFIRETINIALDKRHNMPLMLITNKTPAEIATMFDDPIASRMSEGTRYEHKSRDRRLEP